LVLLALRPLDDELLAVGSDDLVRVGVHAQVYQVEELFDVAQQLLRDALAGGIDAALDPRGAEQDGGGKQADADCFPCKPSVRHVCVPIKK
jgi:hypothetical protein